jgi:hypothetical protein
MSPFANDPYCYPGTDILINLENIRDQKTLNQFEAQTASACIARLAVDPIKGSSIFAACRRPIAASSAMFTHGPANSAKTLG